MKCEISMEKKKKGKKKNEEMERQIKIFKKNTK